MDIQLYIYILDVCRQIDYTDSKWVDRQIDRQLYKEKCMLDRQNDTWILLYCMNIQKLTYRQIDRQT